MAALPAARSRGCPAMDAYAPCAGPTSDRSSRENSFALPDGYALSPSVMTVPGSPSSRRAVACVAADPHTAMSPAASSDRGLAREVHCDARLRRRRGDGLSATARHVRQQEQQRYKAQHERRAVIPAHAFSVARARAQSPGARTPDAAARTASGIPRPCHAPRCRTACGGLPWPHRRSTRRDARFRLPANRQRRPAAHIVRARRGTAFADR